MEKLWRCPIRGENWFLSTPSARRATTRQPLLRRHGSISIHTLREEGDRSVPRAGATARNFYPRPPRGGRHTRYCVQCQSFKFLSTPSARRATEPLLPDHGVISRFLSTPSARRATGRRATLWRNISISIHALREEGDRGAAYALRRHQDFYPRPPRGGRPAHLFL